MENMKEIVQEMINLNNKLSFLIKELPDKQYVKCNCGHIQAYTGKSDKRYCCSICKSNQSIKKAKERFEATKKEQTEV